MVSNHRSNLHAFDVVVTLIVALGVGSLADRGHSNPSDFER
jgi:hypothetical protein